MPLSEERISPIDRKILRALAACVAQHAASPEQDRKRKLWTAHNDLKTEEPVVFIDPENGWGEILPPSTLLCKGDLARSWEMELRKRLFHAEKLKDDVVIDATFAVPHVSHDDGWGLPVIREGGSNGGAYHIKAAIEDYEENFDQVHFPNLTVDQEASERLLSLAQETFDGLLDVEQYTQWWWSLGLTWWYIDLRGLENFLCDFLLEPEWVHRMMNLLCEGAMKRIDWLEANGLLFSNNGNRYVGSGGFGFTEDLPALGRGVSPKAMWGFVESQETSSVSPEMYGEFIYPYHEKLASRFGLNCYGCCEAFEGRWKYVSHLPNLRRVSCSPWSKRDQAAELLGSRYIASHKLSPTPLASANMDEDVVRRHLREVLDHAKGTVPELIMKDNHTLGGNPNNAICWVELARDEISKSKL